MPKRGEAVAGSKYLSRRPDGKGGWTYTYPHESVMRYRAASARGQAYTTGEPGGTGQLQMPYAKAPKKVGRVDAGMTPSQVERAIAGAPREHLVAFVRGKQVWRSLGSQATVVVPSEIADAWRDHGEVAVTHNHPQSMPLSAEDVMLAAGCDLREIRAVTQTGGAWVLKRPEIGWGHPEGLTAYQVRDMLSAANRDAVLRAGLRMDELVKAAGGNPDDGPTAEGYSDEAWREILSEEHFGAYNRAFRSGTNAPKLGWTMEYRGKPVFNWQRDRARRELLRSTLSAPEQARKGGLRRVASGGLGDVVSKAVRRPPGRGWGRIPKPRGGRLGWRRPDGKGGFEYKYDDELTGGQLDLFSQVKRGIKSALPTVLKAPISQVIAVARRASVGKEYTSVVQYDAEKPWTAPDWSPDLASYDHILVNTSAGKDSQAMLDYMVQLADEQGVDRSKIVAIHADLGQAEWERTKELARQQADAYGVRFEWVQRESGDLLDQVRDRYHRLHQRLTDADALRAAGVETFEALAQLDRDAVADIIGPQDEKWTRAFDASKRAQQLLTGARKKSGPIDFGTPIPWPSSQARYCTSDQKTSQIKKWINANTGQNGHERVLNCLGIRAGESPARSKKPGWIEGKTDTRKRQVDQWYPIFGWPERRVWDTIAESGVPYHTAYNKGMGRLSCVFCVFAPKANLVTAAMHNPELFEKYLALEREVGYKFSPNTSLEDVAAEVAKRRRELAETDGVLPVRSTEEIVGGASMTKALESVVDLAPISMALVQGLTALRGQASVVVQWRDHGCCIHLRSDDDDYHLAWYEGNQANAASILAMSMAGDWGVPFEEHGQIPPVESDPLTKAGARPPGRGWMRIPKQRAGSRPGWRRISRATGKWEHKYDKAPSSQPALFSPKALHYWSGLSRPNDIRAARRHGLPIGVVAGELSNNAIDALRDYYGEPGSPPVFVDSGEYNAFSKQRTIEDSEWDTILGTYDDVARAIGEGAHVVAPDAIGDQAETLRRMRRAAERLYDLTAEGAKVLVPLQRGDMPIREFAEAAFDALGAYPGDPEYVPAFPMKKKALEVDAAVEYLREERPAAIHFLGIGMKSPIKAPDGRRVVDVLLEAVQQYSPDTRVTMDSNYARSSRFMGQGAIGTVALAQARKDLIDEAAPRLRTVGDVTYMEPGRLEPVMNAIGAPHLAFTRSQLVTIGRAAGLTGSELSRFAKAPHTYEPVDPESAKRLNYQIERAAFRVYFEKPLTGEARTRQLAAVVDAVRKAVPKAYMTPPPGYSRTPGSRIGTYRKRKPGGGYDYWKPGDAKLYERMGHMGAPQPGDKGYRPPPDRGDALDGRSPVEVAETALAAADALMDDPMFMSSVPLDPDWQATWFQTEETDFFLRDEIVAEGELADLLGLPTTGMRGEPALGTEARSDLAHEILELAAASRATGGLPPGWVHSRYVQQGVVLPRWAAKAVLTDRLEMTSPRKMRLVLVPKDEAVAFVEKHHSEFGYANTRGLIYSIGIKRGDRLTAVALAGHPSRGGEDQRNVLELSRVASDGTTQGAASKLVKRLLDLTEQSRRDEDSDAPALFVTYQLLTEKGASYTALAKHGLRPVGLTPGQKPSGARSGASGRAQAEAPKIRWEAGPGAAPARWELMELAGAPKGAFSTMVQKALAPPKGGGWIDDLLVKKISRPPGRGWGRIPKPRGGRLGWRRPDGKGGYEYRYDDQGDLFSQPEPEPEPEGGAERFAELRRQQQIEDHRAWVERMRNTVHAVLEDKNAEKDPGLIALESRVNNDRAQMSTFAYVTTTERIARPQRTPMGWSSLRMLTPDTKKVLPLWFRPLIDKGLISSEDLALLLGPSKQSKKRGEHKALITSLIGFAVAKQKKAKRDGEQLDLQSPQVPEWIDRFVERLQGYATPLRPKSTRQASKSREQLAVDFMHTWPSVVELALPIVEKTILEDAFNGPVRHNEWLLSLSDEEFNAAVEPVKAQAAQYIAALKRTAEAAASFESDGFNLTYDTLGLVPFEYAERQRFLPEVQQERQLRPWGSAHEQNVRAKLMCIMGDKARYRPTDDDMQLQPARVSFDGRYDGEPNLRLWTEAVQQYNLAQKTMAMTSRDLYPSMYRGLAMSKEVVSAMKPGDRLPLTGCTAFTLSTDVARQYLDQSVDPYRPKAAAGVIIQVERDDVFEASIAAVNTRRSAADRLGTPIYEAVTGGNALEVQSVEKERDGTWLIKGKVVWDD